MMTTDAPAATRYTVRYSTSLRAEPFLSFAHALDWVRLHHPGAFFDLEFLQGRYVLAIFCCLDGHKQIRLGSIGSLFRKDRDGIQDR